MYLYHYFDKSVGPFRNLSDFPFDEALALMEQIKKERPSSQCASRHDKYGLPQDWNDDGAHGPERYIEVHVWSDETIKKYA